MKLATMLPESRIHVGFEENDLRRLVRALLAEFPDVPAKLSEAIVARLFGRDRAARAVEDGFCILHARLDEAERMLVALAVPEEPIPAGDTRADAGAGDDAACEDSDEIRAVFLVVAPREQNSLMLQTMAAISRLAKSKSFASAIRGGARSTARLAHLVEESGIEVKRTITASDVMDPIDGSVTLDTPLVEALDVLSKSCDEGVPVLDEKGRLSGELTTREVLLLGMPKYMDLLANPKMLDAFEPFESFFQNEGRTKVREICRRDFSTVSPTNSVVGVAHLMITQNRRRVYVLDEDKLVGVIYRKSIVAKVMRTF